MKTVVGKRVTSLNGEASFCGPTDRITDLMRLRKLANLRSIFTTDSDHGHFRVGEFFRKLLNETATAAPRAERSVVARSQHRKDGSVAGEELIYHGELFAVAVRPLASGVSFR